MQRQELERLLETNDVLENVLGIPLGRNEIGERLDFVLCLAKPDPPDLYSPLFLSESPNYLAEQERLRKEPYIISLPDGTNIYFRDLDAVGRYLREIGRSLEEVEVMADFWEERN